jgi:hypothetical protein
LEHMLKTRKTRTRYFYLFTNMQFPWSSEISDDMIQWFIDMLAVAKSQLNGRLGISKIFGQCAVQN